MIYNALGGYDAVKNSKMNLNDAANIAGALGFTKTESSASLDRLAKSLAASRRKVRPSEPLDITGRVERQRSA
jgi:hypothetical protein